MTRLTIKIQSDQPERFAIYDGDTLIEGNFLTLGAATERRAVLRQEDSPTVTFNIEAKVDRAFIADVLTCAVEGGIDYWAAFRDIQTVEFGAGRAVQAFEARDAEDPDGPWHTVTQQTIVDGIRIILGQGDCRKDIIASIARAVATNDASDIDAECADVIVQMGLFGSIVFG